MKKGIVDPWRLVTPLRPERVVKPPEKAKINPGDIDLDAELRITQYYVLRSEQGSVRIDSKNIETVDDAMVLLFRCFVSLVAVPARATLFKNAGVGFAVHTARWNVPTEPAVTVKTENAALYFEKVPYENGMLALVRVLNEINRRERGILAKFGISTLLR